MSITNRMLKVFEKQAILVRAFFYTALIEDQKFSPIRPLANWLDYNGYTMVTKPTKEILPGVVKLKVTWILNSPSTSWRCSNT
jgi:uncharacterized LabA/DUF88 family protein